MHTGYSSWFSSYSKIHRYFSSERRSTPLKNLNSEDKVEPLITEYSLYTGGAGETTPNMIVALCL